MQEALVRCTFPHHHASVELEADEIQQKWRQQQSERQQRKAFVAKALSVRKK